MNRPDYGIDAPGLMRAMFLAGGGAALLGVLAGLLGASAWAWLAAGPAAYCLGLGAFMLHYSRVTKVRGRERLLDLVPWRGDEAVLDVGCGGGLLLVAAAQRTPRGRAVGIDLWLARDQSGNRPETALENARREGVTPRVRVETGDMRSLPFADAEFDVVVSHWAVHNLQDPADRALAVREMRRVLRPSGFLVLADIACHAEYVAALRRDGWQSVAVVGRSLRSALAAAASLGAFHPLAVFAQKPAGEAGGGPELRPGDSAK